jgi:hypothetical protein
MFDLGPTKLTCRICSDQPLNYAVCHCVESIESAFIVCSIHVRPFRPIGK